MAWTTPIGQQPAWGSQSLAPLTIGERVLPNDYITVSDLAITMAKTLQSKLWEGDINLIGNPIIGAPRWGSGGDGGDGGGSVRPASGMIYPRGTG